MTESDRQRQRREMWEEGGYRLSRASIDRFRGKLRRMPSGCWEWPGAGTWSGHCQVYVGRRPSGRAWYVAVHRLAWFLANGPIPDGMCVCHRCDNPPCCNPDHLFLGTPRDNAMDMIRKGRHRAAVGEYSGNARLTEAQVVEMRAMRAGGASYRRIGEAFGVDFSTVYAVATGKSWKHAGGPITPAKRVTA